MSIRRMLPLFALFGLLSALAWAEPQIPGLTSSPTPSAQQAAIPPDPLGRETPRGSLLGFIKATQAEKYEVALQYFQPARRHMAQGDEEELAEQLLAILNQKFAGRLELVSRDPLGQLDDGLPPNEEKISTGGTGFSIMLIRIEDEQGRKLWYISRATLEQVPKVYDSLTFPEIEKKIPQYLVEHRFLAVPYWQWLAILFFLPLAFVVARILTLIFEKAVRSWRMARHLPLAPSDRLTKIGPFTFMLALLIHYALVAQIGTSLLYRYYYRRIIWICLAIAF
jgi:MscS family membrane protein